MSNCNIQMTEQLKAVTAQSSGSHQAVQPGVTFQIHEATLRCSVCGSRITFSMPLASGSHAQGDLSKLEAQWRALPEGYRPKCMN